MHPVQLREMRVFGDNGPAVDLDAMDEAIAEADVMVVGFDFTVDRLLLDLRTDEHRGTPPIVEIVEPVGSAQERAVWLSARRPGITPPERFVFFVWPHTVDFLQTSPLFHGVAGRIEVEQGVDVRHDLAGAVSDLNRRERLNTVAAIRGDVGFETLWSRRSED